MNEPDTENLPEPYTDWKKEALDAQEERDQAYEFAFKAIDERNSLRLQLGIAQAQIEETKTFAENVKGGRPVRTEWVADRLEEIVSWVSSQAVYDQSWIHPWWHEQLAAAGHLCGRDHNPHCEGCRYLLDEEKAS